MVWEDTLWEDRSMQDMLHRQLTQLPEGMRLLLDRWQYLSEEDIMDMMLIQSTNSTTALPMV
ncbi:unnamed protein product [Callosobruchus maculatus]|uniref:Uncharacterized protein n=1 Tax=Callosobruchus maculatus TaxID=64391 RepID=A0A653CFJ2_CALMS|nr:unnamed protein product [Callosobruchus maculatus]